MSGWDQGAVYTSSQGLVVPEAKGSAKTDLSLQQRKFREFIRTFRDGNTFIYREMIRQRYNLGEYRLDVDMDDIKAYDGELSDLLWDRPGDFLPLMEAAAKEVAVQANPQKPTDPSFDFQVTLTTNASPTSIRDLSAEHMANLVCVPGIIIAASRTRAKATTIGIRCRNCGNTKQLPCKQGFGGTHFPRSCDSVRLPTETKCPLDPYIVVPDLSDYIDQQTLKLQETPEAVPTGEMPRHILLSVDRYLVGQLQPGTRATIVGVYSIFSNNASHKKSGSSVTIRNPYIRVVGVISETDGAGRMNTVFMPEEEAEFREFSRVPNLMDRLSKSIAPAIYGHDDIKRAMVCQLFGGARKQLPDGMRLRGDVNVLLLGDPGVAKSQFLKFMEKVAPIGVYTSGKGSSAAGLTASVIRDPTTREFCLEGGAMVLADGGIVCIDEFDKMRDQDRVAIHEAMEQQTISIAKAGITTILNSRAAVLAAANPVFGRYDDARTPAENIHFQTTILSRFDMIFIVKDIRNEQRDKVIATHVMNVHMNPEEAASREDSVMDIGFLKRYIAYVRQKCSPRLNPAAAELLKNHYVAIRSGSRESAKETFEKNAIPITVRQLEAIVRISEALAKITMSQEAAEAHVQEAIRLFRVSTLDATNTGDLIIEGNIPQEHMRQIQQVELQFKRRFPIGSATPKQRILNEYASKGIPASVINMVLRIMIQRNEIEEYNKGANIRRKK
eukprot:TRINITY_DN11478_c0_g1_i1.p1 TRINITY_DN11478_c0_g1~~TRINITY_DN11478_c0_g1_i1.p1  ORF type:complete len:726 (-),score=163.07 TRINITY_DN11478_c0_g1_i1:394-2571(-)